MRIGSSKAPFAFVVEYRKTAISKTIMGQRKYRKEGEREKRESNESHVALGYCKIRIGAVATGRGPLEGNRWSAYNTEVNMEWKTGTGSESSQMLNLRKNVAGSVPVPFFHGATVLPPEKRGQAPSAI